MQQFEVGRVVLVPIVVLALASAAVPTRGICPDVPKAEPGALTSMLGTRYVRIADDRPSSHRVPPPRTAELSIQGATFDLLWNPAQCPEEAMPWPHDAQAAFEYAATIWGSLISSSQPIVVIACWLPESAWDVDDWIGGAMALNLYQDFPNAPAPGTLYPVALANALAGDDLNGDRAEIDGWFNGDRGDWYFGTDGNPAPDELDFVSLVLHELGHGLGFGGRADVTGGQGSIGPPPWMAAYDRFTEDGAGTALLDYPNPSAALGDALVGQAGGVFFDGPQATAANGGPVKLYAPNPWNSSSYSHVDEETFNDTPNSLMTPIQNDGESEHHPGPVTLGMFQDMGWGAVNAAPTISGLPDQLLAVGETTDNAIDLWAYTFDGQTADDGLVFSIVGTPNPAAGVSLDSNRYIDIFPTVGWLGETDVTIRATDPGDLSSADTFRVTVAELTVTYLPLVLGQSGPAPPGWITIVSEDFEGSFPGTGWQVVDENGDGGLYHWGTRDCRASGGSYSAWSVGAGDASLGCGADYPGDVFSWMVYGPFSLADATAAELVFDWWSDSAGSDEFFYGASTDDYSYRGVHITGDHTSWTTGEVFDLSAVPDFGSLLGEDQVWIGFSFGSGSPGDEEGAYVDNVLVRKRIGSHSSADASPPAHRPASSQAISSAVERSRRAQPHSASLRRHSDRSEAKRRNLLPATSEMSRLPSVTSAPLRAGFST
jgi:hypothetical protein